MQNFDLSQLRWLPIIVAAFAYFGLGAIWYSVLFRKTWIRASGVDMNNPNAKKGAGALFGLTFLLEFIISTGLAVIIARTGATGGAISGAKIGLLAGGIAAIAVTISYLYQMKPKVLSVIDGGYHIVGCIIAAIIICIWK